jgi:hypothetical protein
MFQAPAKDENQAKFFAIDAELRSRAAYAANKEFFTSQSHQSKVEAVVATLRNMLRVNGISFYEKIFETARDQKSKGVYTDVTVYKFQPSKYVKSAEIVAAMEELGFVATYSPKSCNIKIVVK